MGDEHPQTSCVTTEKLEPLLIAGKARLLIKVLSVPPRMI
jgi:hypothetical protein